MADVAPPTRQESRGEMPGKNIYDAVGVEDCYPLSPMQQGMLFDTLADTGPGVDIDQLVCELREVLDTAALRRAWQRLVDRHPVLRTRFHWEHPDQSRQAAFASINLAWEERDGSAVLLAQTSVSAQPRYPRFPARSSLSSGAFARTTVGRRRSRQPPRWSNRSTFQ